MKKTALIIAITLLLSFACASSYSGINNENNKVNHCNELTNTENKFATIYIDDIKISSPQLTTEIELYLIKIKELVSKKTSSCIKFKYGNNLELILKTPYLGIGKHAMVFDIIDGKNKVDADKILKLNILDGINGLLSAVDEHQHYIGWQKKAADYSFTVAKLHEYHPAGLFSIKAKNQGISLTRMLMQLGLIYIVDKEAKTTGFNKLTDQDLKNPRIKQIFTAIFDMLDVIKNDPSYCTSLSPNNIFVAFKDKSNNIEKIELIDYGKTKNAKKVEQYIALKHANQYIEIASDRLKKYITINYIF
jgi:hypothetical protein